MNRTLLISMFCIAVASSTAAHATDAVVGPANCNEGGFNDALATVDGSGGGTITFDCGTATITFTGYKSIAHATTVDGGNTITLDGANTSALFQIFASANATLRGLTLQHGVFSASHAIEIFGNLTLDHDRVTANSSTESPVVIEGGGLTVSSTTFSQNALSGSSGTGGAISNLDGTLSITGSTFDSNGAFDGDAIYVDPSAGAVHIASSTFHANTGGYGSAIENWGNDTEIATSTFANNHATTGDGGAIWSVAGSVSVDQSEFDGNVASTTGGAISCYGDSLTVTASTFASNQASGDGGAIFSTCALSATNVTMTGNTATGSGGAIYQNYSANSTLTFATVDGNSAVAGSGLYNEGSASGVLFVGNSIVSANPNGNCAGVLASNGYNLSDDMFCGSAFTGPGDLLNQSLNLQPLANYGGPTLTQPPATGNPAIDHVPTGAACAPPVDQRGQARPFGSGCDSGSVEVGGPLDEIFRNGFDP